MRGSAEHEKRNVMPAHPETAARLKDRLVKWAGELQPAGLREGKLRPPEIEWFSHYKVGQDLAAPPSR